MKLVESVPVISLSCYKRHRPLMRQAKVLALVDTLEIAMELRMFSAARVLVLVFMVCLFMAFIAAAASYGIDFLSTNSHVKPSEVAAVTKRATHGTSEEAVKTESNERLLATVKMPRLVTDEFKSDNRDVLAGWLEAVGSDRRQEFVDNMEEVLAAAKANGESTTDAVNTYKALKIEKIRAEREANPNSFRIVAVLITTLITFVLLTLILVMLAVERNTRTPTLG